MNPIFLAFFAQILALPITYAIVAIAMPYLSGQSMPIAVIQGLCASFAAYKLESQIWWIPIHWLFPPLLIVALQSHIPPTLWLILFCICLLVFWRTDTSQVPLYLSNTTTINTIAEKLSKSNRRFLDVGCGTGSLVSHLASQHPNISFHGIEHAPIPWLIAWLRSVGQGNLHIHYGNFWKHDFSPYDIIYAFLSPVPMAPFWEKAKNQMKSNSLIISNSFPIPVVVPNWHEQLTDRRQTELYGYLIEATTDLNLRK